MKKCPVCEKEYDDNMRFCQTDGTALVEKAEQQEPADPYKTMVARKDDIAAAIPKETPKDSPSVVPPVPSPIEEQLLEIPPANDPNKTQFVSEAELRAEMEKHPDNQVIDVPPATEDAKSEIPVSGEPEKEAPAETTSGPPPSPFSAPQEEDSGPANFPTSPPIPSPFGAKPKSAEASPAAGSEGAAPQFSEPSSAANPFNEPPSAPMAQADKKTPSTPEPNMQNPQNFGQNVQQSASPNQTLAMVSLILGIVSLVCCSWTFVLPLAAIITGFMARGKATSDPANYGGAGLALGGIITGAVSLLLGIVLIVLNVFFGLLGTAMQGIQ